MWRPGQTPQQATRLKARGLQIDPAAPFNLAGKPYRMQELDDVPVNSLSDVDTTGGNSGSLTLNAKEPVFHAIAAVAAAICETPIGLVNRSRFDQILAEAAARSLRRGLGIALL